MTLGLKRQLKDERALYKALSEEHKKLKESLKSTSVEELAAEV
jgi:hypothetical protein